MKTMPNSTQDEKLRWIAPILDDQISIKKMVLICPFSERALKYWLTNFRDQGLSGLINHSTRPKSHPKETSIRIKERIIELRNETDLSALKLSFKLKKEGIFIHSRTIGKILKTEGLVRKYRSRKIRYQGKRKTTLFPGELVEIDIKYVPSKLAGKRYYQFTAIDCASRWRYLEIFDDKTNFYAVKFLKTLIQRAPFTIKAIKTDNDPCFTNRYLGYPKSIDVLNPRLHPFDLVCQKYDIVHYLIDPGKPQQNGHVERSHRSDQESFYAKMNFRDIEDLKYQVKLWNMYYNDLEHCSLNGLTPNEALGRVQNVYS